MFPSGTGLSSVSPSRVAAAWLACAVLAAGCAVGAQPPAGTAEATAAETTVDAEASGTADAVAATAAADASNPADGAGTSPGAAADCAPTATSACVFAPVGSAGPPPCAAATPCPLALPAAWTEAGLAATPDVFVELGQYVTPSAAFVAYAEGSWAAIVHGPQGLTHIVADVRVTAPGMPTEQVTAAVQRSADYTGCLPLSGAQAASVALVPLGIPGQFGHPGKQKVAVFPVAGSQSATLCGAWLDVRAAVRLPNGRWGETRRVLRLWDQAPAPP